MISLAFLRQAAPALGFGALLTFASSVGQTFFVSLFAGEMRAEFGLSHGTFGALYTGATLASAASLIVVGKLADHVPLPRLAALTAVGLACASALAAVAPNALILALALFGLRLFGQGMPGHVAMTAMGRWFGPERGRAIGVVTLGYPLGEAILPAMVAALVALTSWRAIWAGVALLMLTIVVPAVWALGRSGFRGRGSPAGGLAPVSPRDSARSYTRAEVLSDPRFYALLPGILAPPFTVTGVLFHQVHLVETKGWSLAAFAATYPLYAAASAVAGLVAGRAIDRFGVLVLLAVFLLPLTAGLALLALSDAPLAAGGFMALTGATSGATTIVLGALWPELYGTRHLGAIRALGVTLMVFSTALAPIVSGVLIDHGVALTDQVGVVCVYLTVCSGYFAAIRPWLARTRDDTSI